MSLDLITDFLFLIVSAIAGAIASVTGFGIGSILTPILALETGTKLAVAVISIPHFVATVIRFWLMRAHVNKKVLMGFGITSALGGLIGALLHSTFQSSVLTFIFGGLLIFAGFMGFTGLAQKMRFHGPIAWVAGALSGGFGGLVGNQGGIRSAALMAFNLPKESLIATATAIGVIVDLARMPIYFASGFEQIAASWVWIVIGTLGVMLGTWFGARFLRKISESVFRKILGAVIFSLGLYMIIRQSLLN
ncbi:MAG: hypothetical protein A2X86_10315 [Bdellovibrionales bacterium GWA2_49_15]|nr:MAG: hypothetical protein A2X86_10315 [Bdellovibrionales bacterium GWA2_49_15]